MSSTLAVTLRPLAPAASWKHELPHTGWSLPWMWELGSPRTIQSPGPGGRGRRAPSCCSGSHWAMPTWTLCCELRPRPTPSWPGQLPLLWAAAQLLYLCVQLYPSLWPHILGPPTCHPCTSCLGRSLYCRRGQCTCCLIPTSWLAGVIRDHHQPSPQGSLIKK